MNTYTFYENLLINGFNFEDRDTQEPTELLDRVNAIYDIFKDEYGHEIARQNGNEVAAFKERLQGLPSVIDVVFMNHEILELANAEGFNLMTEQAEDNFLTMYWYNLAAAFFTLKNNL